MVDVNKVLDDSVAEVVKMRKNGLSDENAKYLMTGILSGIEAVGMIDKNKHKEVIAKFSDAVGPVDGAIKEFNPLSTEEVESLGKAVCAFVDQHSETPGQEGHYGLMLTALAKLRGEG